MLIETYHRRSFDKLSELRKPEVLEVIGKLPCVVTGNMVQRPSEVIARDTFFCLVCDGEQSQHSMNVEGEPPAIEKIWTMFNFILARLTRTPGPRVAAMIALRRILMHSSHSKQMHLSTSPSGEFCLHSLRSSIRELRIATGYVCDYNIAPMSGRTDQLAELRSWHLSERTFQ